MQKSNWQIAPARGSSRQAVVSDPDIVAAAMLVNDVFMDVIDMTKEVPVAEQKKQMVKVGALWFNISKAGTPYLSGSLADGTKIIAFINEEVKEDPDTKKPYITIYEKN